MSSHDESKQSINQDSRALATRMSREILGDDAPPIAVRMLTKDIQRAPFFFGKVSTIPRGDERVSCYVGQLRHLFNPGTVIEGAEALGGGKVSSSLKGEDVLVKLAYNSKGGTNARFSEVIECEPLDKPIDNYLDDEPEIDGLLRECLRDLDGLPSSKEVVDYMKMSDKLKNLNSKIEQCDNELGRKNAEKQGLESKCAEKQERLDELAKEFDEKQDAIGRLNAKCRDLAHMLGKRDDATSLPTAKASSRLGFDAVRTRDRFEDHALKTALMALWTNQIIVLTGKPGTGKSTFARELAEAIGASFTSIAVQPNWSDAESLFGYYDPINKRFSETPFLTALLDARAEELEKRNDSRLHVICLDEMNLARVEYYFATFLSLMQANDKGRAQEKRLVSLLPRDIEESLNAGEHPGLTPHEASSLERYRRFPIPDNVRFIGTVNMDDTTNDLSPKVIDRSIFIPFYDRTPNTDAAAFEHDYQPPSFYYPLESFKPESDRAPEAIPDYLLRQCRLNPRFDRYATEMWAAYRDMARWDSALENETEFFDLICLSKVLPTLPTENRRTDGEYEGRKKLDDLVNNDGPGGENQRPEIRRTGEHLNRMEEFARQYGAFTFFCER